MFIDIDYNKKIKNAKLHLAKPNRTVIGIITEKFSDSAKFKLGSVNELTFSIPYKVDNKESVLIDNEDIYLIKEKMLIKLTFGAYKEWFIVDSIEEDGGDTDTFTVSCYSYGNILKDKESVIFEEDMAYNGTQALTHVLTGTEFVLGEVDTMFDHMYRSMKDVSSSDSTRMESLNNVSEAFGGLIVWNTENKSVSLKDPDAYGKFRGLTVNYGRLLKTIRKTRTTDEMVTRLYIEGSDGLSINNVNPTGQRYIEDFSYFMYPFERDEETKEVLKSSYYMSDDLCHAILDHSKSVKENTQTIKNKQNLLATKRSSMTILESDLILLEGELENILGLLDIAKSTNDTALITQRESEKHLKQQEVNNKKSEVLILQQEIDTFASELDTLYNTISNESNFTQELIEELDFYIIEKTWRDDRYIDEQELYDDGLREFIKIREPKIVLDVSMDNLMNVIEEQHHWDKLVVGDRIKVRYPQMNLDYMATIVEIEFDFEQGVANLIVANTRELLDDMEKLQQLIYKNASATTVLEVNKHKWDRVNKVENDVLSIIQNAWDATKNKIIAGVNNSVEISKRGIIIQNPDFPNEVIIMQSGVLALSKDGGENWQTAITPDGVVAERLLGRIIAGESLSITNKNGSFTFDNDGVVIEADSFIVRSSSGSNLKDDWQNATEFTEELSDDNLVTPYEKKILLERWNNEYEPRYSYTIDKLNTFFDDGGDSIQSVIDYKNNYQNLYNYLYIDLQADGYSILDNQNMSETSAINKLEYNTIFNNFSASQMEVDSIIEKQAKILNDGTESKITSIETRITDDAIISTVTGSTTYSSDLTTLEQSAKDYTNNSFDRLDIIAVRDKTEILSGTEIYTDKADDSVVHVVGIDGRSYQHARGGKNLFNIKHYVELEKNLFAPSTYSLDSQSRLKIHMEDVRNTEIELYRYIINIKENTDYIFSADTEMNWKINIYDVEGNLILNTTNMQGKEVTFNSGSGGVQLTTRFLPVETPYYPITVGDIQLEEATDYELPVPTLDSPIEIHSLNDFDIVSQRLGEGFIDGVEIDGRNYVTKEKIDNMYLVKIDEWSRSRLDRNNPDCPNGFHSIGIGGFFRMDNAIDSNGYWTVSFDMKWVQQSSPLEALQRVSIGNSDYVQLGVTESEGWKHVSATFHIEDYDGENGYMDFNQAYSETYVRNLRLEKNKKANGWTPAPEDHLEDYNYENIDKINILLDEPLRSHEDVKDRLFRDIDGLWKIERKIKERIFTGNERISQSNGVSLFYNDYSEIADNWYRPDTFILCNYLKVAPIESVINGEENTVSLSTSSTTINMSIVVDGVYLTESTIKQWLTEKYDSGNPLIFHYLLKSPTVEILDDKLQDKLNSLKSFKNHNYVYTIFNENNISSNIANNLKPTLHTIFKSGGWYHRFNTEKNNSQVELIGTRVNNVENEINSDGIVTTITESVTFKNALDTKVGAEALGDFATRDELNELGDEISDIVDTSIQGINLEPYATKLELEETSKDITAKFSATGGMNLIKNSIGFAGLEFWDNVSSIVSSVQNNELDVLGFGSGFIIPHNDLGAGAFQKISVVRGQRYTFSWYENVYSRDSDGYTIMRIHDGDSTNSPIITSEESKNTTQGFEYKSVTFTPSSEVIYIRMGTYLTEAGFTGLMMNIGGVPIQWTLATGELYNTNIRMDVNGIRVSQLDGSRKEIGYTQITPDEFAGYYDPDGDGVFERVFYLNGEETVTKKFRAEDEITMGTIKAIKIESSTRSGWAFVPTTDLE